ncbi:MAG: substrate-binding domain-containing protein [Bacillota bacterium]|jgi:ribose transport system substrate-binding protein
MGKKISVALFLILGLLTVFLIIQLNMILGNIATELAGKPLPAIRPRIRLAFIYQSNYNPFFWNKIKEGAVQAGQNEDLSINFMEVVHERELQAPDYFNLAIAANYDGIIIRGDDERLLPLIHTAENAGVPTILIASDLPDSGRIGYVGTNNYRAGYAVGKILTDHFAKAAEPRFAVLSPLIGTDLEMSVAESLKVFGFREAISSRRTIVPIWEKANPTLIDSMITVRNLLRKYPELDGIYATYAEGTLATARVIEEHNLGGKIKIVGHGDWAAIRGYIKSGVVEASVVEYPYQIGAAAVTEMARYLRKEGVNISTTIDTVVLDRDNVVHYQKRGVL